MGCGGGGGGSLIGLWRWCVWWLMGVVGHVVGVMGGSCRVVCVVVFSLFGLLGCDVVVGGSVVVVWLVSLW